MSTTNKVSLIFYETTEIVITNVLEFTLFNFLLFATSSGSANSAHYLK
jgi:hypothetical protein